MSSDTTPRLTWNNVREFAWNSQQLGPGDIPTWYSIDYDAYQGAYVSSYLGRIVLKRTDPALYTSLDDAKAACERHYATGSWE